MYNALLKNGCVNFGNACVDVAPIKYHSLSECLLTGGNDFDLFNSLRHEEGVKFVSCDE